jgi:hypothetical protein
MPSAEFEPTIPAHAWPQTHTLDRRGATGIGVCRRVKGVKAALVKLPLWNIYASDFINRDTYKSKVFIQKTTTYINTNVNGI